MTAALVQIIQLQQQAREATTVAKLVEQKLDALAIRADSSIPASLSAQVFDARHALLLVASALDAELQACGVTR
jgi:hypothetical protein